jgi:transposase
MRPYSTDLRQRVAEAADQKEGSLRQLARRFQVSLSFVTRLLGLRRQTGSVAPRPHRGGRRPALDEAGQQRLRALLQEQPDLTLDELCQRLGQGCSRMAVWRALRKLDITRKKKVTRADERARKDVQRKRQAFQQELATLDPKRLVFVDEMGANTAMARTHGRAPKGERVYGSVPGQWESMTLISGLRLGGLVAPWTLAGATNTQAFATYTEAILAPELRQGDVVIWDNLKPHQDKEVIEAVERVGARVLPAPPWSPDLIPIEKMFSKVKGVLRSLAARSTEALVDAMAAGLRRVCPKDILGWFKSCGLAADSRRRADNQARGPLDRYRSWGLCAMQA